MKLFSAIIVGILTVISVIEAKDYYRDEKGKTYVIGIYGERVYEDSEGNMDDRTKKTRQIGVNADLMTTLGWNMFQNSNSNDDSDNFVVSSLGTQLILSLIAKESSSTTKNEIKVAIGEDGHRKLGKLIKLLTTEDSDRQLEIETAMFVNSDYQQSLKDSYKHEANKSNVFIAYWDLKDPKKAQTKYDQWLKLKTNGIIKSQPLSINRDTKMILSSSIYFKGNWIFEFTQTEPLIFKKSVEETFPVPTIKSVFKKYHYGYLHDYNGEWLSIPYNSTEALIILLPNKTKNFQIDEFIENTPSSDITDIIDIINDRAQPNTLVNITMPKFKIDSTIDIKDGLKKMGISKIFSQDAEFYPLSDNQPLHVSSATQQCSLEVNEKGSVGASISKFSVVALSIKAPVEKVNFVVDRPFVAIVINRLYRLPYFVAKVSDPRGY